MNPYQDNRAHGTSRRGFLGSLGVGAAGVLAAGGGYGVARATSADKVAEADIAPVGAAAVPFYGTHQAGIGTEQQARLMFASFDIVKGAKIADIQQLMSSWAAAGARMCEGEVAGPGALVAAAPPTDTGEALGLPASQLTITVGFGPSMFDGRFGLSDRRPAALVDLPRFGDREQIDPNRSHGDICVQACSNDPMVAFHAVRNLARIATGTAVLKWSQLGFGRTSGTVVGQLTARNLMGFKDGTNNVLGDSGSDMNSFIWVDDSTDQPWMRGGSYCVTRRIRMYIENWDSSPLSEQENVFGRKRDSGAPQTGTHEFDTVDLAAKDQTGKPIIAMNAHIRLAAPETNNGQKILRRGYSFTDGIDPITGEHDAGLFFIGYQSDPRQGFIPIQKQLTAHDALNEYITHTSSGIYAIPPGLTKPGDYYGRALFGG